MSLPAAGIPLAPGSRRGAEGADLAVGCIPILWVIENLINNRDFVMRMEF